jgi:Oxidoreductase family, NAD-binding Rossmann fold
MIDREKRLVERRIRAARFPAVKSLDSYHFTALPSLNKALVLELARCEYGTGGQHFRAPFIAAAEGVELAGVIARAPGTIARVEADLPGTPIFPSLAAMIDAGGIDAVTITTPPETRRELVLEALDAGLHVVADKPFAPTAEGGRELDAAARAKGSCSASSTIAGSTRTSKYSERSSREGGWAGSGGCTRA